MSDLSARASLPSPLGTEAADAPTQIEALADAVDALILVWLTGNTAGRPGASLNGRVYYETDGDRYSYDMGSTWRKILMQTADGKYTGDAHINATGYEVSGTALASTHLSDTAALARLAGPTFTGVPAVPTAAADTNTTQAASTAYVLGQASSATPAMDGTATVGTSTRWAHGDHIHPTDTSRAALASPTLTGAPLAPTAAADMSTTQIATTAYVLGQAGTSTPTANGSATAGTSTRWSRQDHVHPLSTPADNSVSTAKIVAAAVTPAKLSFTPAQWLGNPASAQIIGDSTVVSLDGSGQASIGFDGQTFPSGILAVLAVNGDDIAQNMVVSIIDSSVSTSGFAVQCRDFAGAAMGAVGVRINWFAVGF